MITTKKKPSASEFLDEAPSAESFLDEKPSADSFLDQTSMRPVYPKTSVAKEVVKGIPGVIADIASPGSNLEEVKQKVKDVAAATAYTGAGVTKGLTMGYVDPASLLEKTPLKDANISKRAAEMGGEFAGTIAPISGISKVASAALQSSNIFNTVRPVLQGLVQSGVTGAAYGFGKNADGSGGIAKRAHNALEDAANFIVFTGAGQLFDKAIQSFKLGKTDAYNSLRQEIIDTFVKKGAKPDEAAQMADIGIKQAIDKGGGWGEVTKKDLNDARNAIKKGQKIVIGAETAEAPVDSAPVSKENVPGGTSLEPFKPALPPAGVRHLVDKMPNLAQVVNSVAAKSHPEQLQKAIQGAHAAATEAIIKNGTSADTGSFLNDTGTVPDYAQNAAIEHFVDKLRNGEIGPRIEPQTPSAKPSEVNLGEKVKNVFIPDKTLQGGMADQQTKSLEYAVKNAPKLIQEYAKLHGNEVSTDKFRDLLRPIGYTGLNSEAYHSAASALRKTYQDVLLDQAKKAGKTDVVVTAGGSGSGKSSFLSNIDKKDAAMVLDANLADYQSAHADLEAIKKQGFNVNVRYIYRDPTEAWFNGVLHRLRSRSDYRIVPLQKHLDLHKGSFETIQKLAQDFPVKIIDNSMGKGTHKFISLEELKQKGYNDIGLKERLINETLQRYAKGEIGPREVRSAGIGVPSEGKLEEQLGRSTSGSKSGDEGTQAKPESGLSPEQTNYLSTEHPTPDRIQPAPLSDQPPKPLKNIILDVSKGLKTRVITGKFPKGGQSSKTVGTYYPGSSATVIRYSGDLDTTAHELAHSLDDKFGIVSEWNRPGNLSPFDDELKQFWPHGSVTTDGPRSTLSYKRAEGVAEFLRAFLVNPDEAVRMAPDFSKYVFGKIPPETIKILKSFSDDIRRFAGATAHEKIMANVNWKPDTNGLFGWMAGGNVGHDFKLTWADKMLSLLQDDLHAYNKAVDFVKGERGISEILPVNDPQILSRLVMGVHAKMDDIFEHGMIDSKDQRITPGGFTYLMKPLDSSSPKSLEKDMQETASLMIAERTVEKIEKPLANKIAETEKYFTDKGQVFIDYANQTIGQLNTALKEQKATLIGAKFSDLESLKEKTRVAIEKSSDDFKKKVDSILEAKKEAAKIKEARKVRIRQPDIKDLLTEKSRLAKQIPGIEQIKHIKDIDSLYESHKNQVSAIAKNFESELEDALKGANVKRVRISGKIEEFISENEKTLDERRDDLIRFFERKRISGIGGGMEADIDVARSRISELQKNPIKYAKLKEASRRYREWADATLKYMVDKGRLSQEQYATIKANNEYYVAMNRLMEIAPNEEVIGFRPKTGGKIGSVSQPIQKFKGSTRTIQNPYTSLMESTYRSIRESDRNDALRAFRNLLNVERPMGKGQPLALSEVGRLAQSGEKNTIPIFVNGKKEVWQFHPEVYKALKGLVEGSYQVPWPLTVPAKILRTTVVNSPPFAVRNWFRDLQHRLVVSDVGSGLMDSLRKRGPMSLENLRLHGGDQGGHYMRDRMDYMRAMDTALKDLVKKGDTILLHPRRLVDAYKRLMEMTETSGRLAEYEAAFRHAKNVLKYDDLNANLFAASKARGLMDFSIAGSLIRVINQMVPFTSASVQGLSRTMQAAGKNPGSFMFLWGLTAVIPAIATYVYNQLQGDMKEYRQHPAYIRDMFYNFKLGPNRWIRIPKSYEIGVLATGMERLLDSAMGNKHAFQGYGGDVLRGLLPVDESATAGPFKAIMEVVANYDFFRQKHIIPVHEEKLDLDLRDTSRGSHLSQALQSVAGVDARNIDFLMREMFGYAGSFATDLSDIGRKDRKGIGLSQTGIVIGSPAYASQDVQWVLDMAGRRNLTNRPEYKQMNQMIKQYFSAESNEAKDKTAETLRDFASNLRSQWERNLPVHHKKVKSKQGGR